MIVAQLYVEHGHPAKQTPQRGAGVARHFFGGQKKRGVGGGMELYFDVQVEGKSWKTHL